MAFPVHQRPAAEMVRSSVERVSVFSILELILTFSQTSNFNRSHFDDRIDA
jgi:hypothetical protein